MRQCKRQDCESKGVMHGCSGIYVFPSEQLEHFLRFRILFAFKEHLWTNGCIAKKCALIDNCLLLGHFYRFGDKTKDDQDC